MDNGVLLWNEFADGKLKHWCRYMNESLINIIFLSSNVYIQSLYQKGEGIIYGQQSLIVCDRLREFLIFVVDTFFMCHDSERRNVSFMEQWHILGLAHFYKLNVTERGSDNSITMSVPYPVDYTTPRQFSDLMNSLIISFIDMFQNRFSHQFQHETVPYTQIQNTYGGHIQWIIKDYVSIEDFQFRGVILLSERLLLSSFENLSTEQYVWCRGMIDELLGQLYAAFNALYYVHVICKPPGEDQNDRVAFIHMFTHPIQDVCTNFFQIDCVRVAPMIPNKNQWSGEWGIKMFFESNFWRVNEELYEQIYPDDSEIYTRDYFHYRLPYPCITLKDKHERSLAYAMMGREKLRATQSLPHAFQSMAASLPEILSYIDRLSLFQEERSPRLTPQTPASP